MKFTYSLKQKSKIAILLFLIMACTVLIRLLEDKSIKSLQGAFSTMYHDRLIPATDIFHISEKLYAKRSLIEHLAYADTSVNFQKAKSIVKQYDVKIASLLEKYQQTYLVKTEKSDLETLKNRLEVSKILETSFLNSAESLSKSEIKKQYATMVQSSYLEISTLLSRLTNLQTVVGEELQTETNKIVSGTKLYSAIQLILAVLIGILIVSILFASNVVSIKNDKYHLN